MKRGRASTSPIRGTKQHGIELSKEWIDEQKSRST
jgi:hypothetical protein